MRESRLGANPKSEDIRKEFRREVSDAFAANLRRLRTESGLSQEKLSLRASLNRTHVGMIENGDRAPAMDTIVRLAGALEVEPDELFAGIYWRPDDSEAGGHFTDAPPPETGKG